MSNASRPSPSVLLHNPANAVTQSIGTVTLTDGRTRVHKRLGPTKVGAPPHWHASEDPRHWNYWRREAEAYRSELLALSLAGTGLAMPAAEVSVTGSAGGAVGDQGIELRLEYVAGRPGTEFDLRDHAALATGLGRWQARPPVDAPWTSRGFLREYSGSRPAPDLLDDDAAWAHPLVGCFPDGLRSGWQRLVAHRERLLRIVEALPRVAAHLDVWPANVIRRGTPPAAAPEPGSAALSCAGEDPGDVVLLDWSFYGDGAIGEDVGNHVPDSVFDLFWPADRLEELDQVVFTAYVDGLRQGGWRGDERLVRLGMVASCVKYTWLLPGMLASVHREQQHAYGRPVPAELLYTERGPALALLVAWCDEALDLADRLGR